MNFPVKDPAMIERLIAKHEYLAARNFLGGSRSNGANNNFHIQFAQILRNYLAELIIFNEQVEPIDGEEKESKKI